jgi:site-specific recombinase XerD
MNESLTNRSTFRVLFYLNRVKTNSKREHPIYCRLTVNGKSREMSTQICLDEKKWNVKSNRVIGNNEISKTSNARLETIANKFLNIRNDLEAKGKTVTADTIMNAYKGKISKKYTLLGTHEYFNEHFVKPQIGKAYAEGTHERYKTSLFLVKEFMKKQQIPTDLPLAELTFPFINGYEFYLLNTRGCANNTAVKYVKNLMRVINFAVNQEWLPKNPFSRYNGKLEQVNRTPLRKDEIQRIANLKLTIPRLDRVRDIFVFCCYTGLAFADVSKLTINNLAIGLNGGKMIQIKRTKTDILSSIPLLDIPISILNKYQSDEECQYRETLLPVLTNQKYNAYLKEIADLAGIKKKLTTHIARHSFATLMLTNEASLESVSAMLGHANLKTTQVYAKVIQEKLFTDMKKVSNNLSKAV